MAETPKEMIEKAATAVREYDDFIGLSFAKQEKIARLALEAAGVPALLERIAELEAQVATLQIHLQSGEIQGMHWFTKASEQRTRIAEMEADFKDARAIINDLKKEIARNAQPTP